jgi:hypothetical protein
MMMSVVPLVSFDQLSLRLLEMVESLFRVTSKLETFVSRLCLLDMVDALFSSRIGVSEIWMMDFVRVNSGSHENRQRTDKKSFHDDPLG